MIRHVAILIISALTINVSEAERIVDAPKQYKHDGELTLDDPVEAFFPELEYEEKDQRVVNDYNDEQDPPKKLDKFNGIAGLWEKYKANLTP